MSSFWHWWGSTIIGVAVVIVATVAVIAYMNTGDLDRRLTPLEQAPCRAAPESVQCHQYISLIINHMTPEQAAELLAKAERSNSE